MHIVPNLSIMLLVFFVFLITMYCLNHFVFKPLITFMDERDSKIASYVETVRQNRKEVENKEKQIIEIIENAKQEAHNIIQKQVNDSKEIAQSKIEKINSENKAKFSTFMSDLDKDREFIKQEIKSHLYEFEELLVHKIKNI